jgi:hypothetical protein
MSTQSENRRLRVVISDEETGEEVAIATGVETLVLLVAPDTLEHQDSRRILVGDPELSVQLLVDIVTDVSKKIGQGSVVDLTDELDDQILLDMTDGLPAQ